MYTNKRPFGDYSKEKGTIAEVLCLSFADVDELTKRRYFFKVRGKYCLGQCMHGYENYKEDVIGGCTKPLKGDEVLASKEYPQIKANSLKAFKELRDFMAKRHQECANQERKRENNGLN